MILVTFSDLNDCDSVIGHRLPHHCSCTEHSCLLSFLSHLCSPWSMPLQRCHMCPMLLNEGGRTRPFATTSGSQQGQELAAGCESCILFPYFEVELGLRFFMAENCFSFGDRSWKIESSHPQNVIYRNVPAWLMYCALISDFFEDRQSEV